MDELLKKYDLNEISKRTSISPVVLQRLIEEKFDLIEELKFKGFLKILKSEFKDIDFSDLEEKAKSYYFNADDSKKTDKQQIIEKLEEDKKSYKDYLFVLILIMAIVGLIYYMNNNKKTQIENNSTNLETLPIIEKNDTNFTNDINETNLTQENNTSITTDINVTNLDNNQTLETNQTEKETNLTTIENNSSDSFVENNIFTVETNLTIKPLRKVWFRVYFLDLNKSKEFLTREAIELNGSKNLFIKFGHGMVKLYYKDKIFFPNTKKVVRIILKDGELNITKKRLKSFK